MPTYANSYAGAAKGVTLTPAQKTANAAYIAGGSSSPSVSTTSATKPITAQTNALRNYVAPPRLGSSGAPPRLGSSGAPAGSQAPVAPLAPPKSGTVGNPAGSQLPTGTAVKNTKAAVAAATTVGPKKPDWMTTLENNPYTPNSTPNPATPEGGMSRLPVAKPTPQNRGMMASAWDSVSSLFGGSSAPTGQAANGGLDYNAPESQAASSILNPSGISPVTQKYSSAPVSNFSAGMSTGSSVPNMTINTAPAQSRESITSQIAALNNSQSSSKVAPSTTTPSVASPSTVKFGIDNTNKTTTQTQVQQATQKTDDLANQMEANRQAAAAVPDEYVEEKKLRTQQFEDSRNTYLESKKHSDALDAQSEEEKQAQSEDDALAAQQAGVDAGLNQKVTDINKEPISSKFLEGWGGTFNKDASAKLQVIAALRNPLQTKLARLQQARQAAFTRAQSATNDARDFYKTAESNLTSLSAEQRKRKNEVADQKTKFAQDQQLQGQKERYVSIGDGSQLYDTQTGKTVANNAKDVTRNSTTQYTSTTVPSKIRGDIVADLGKPGVTLQTLYSLYPDVDTNYLSSIFKSIHSGIDDQFAN